VGGHVSVSAPGMQRAAQNFQSALGTSRTSLQSMEGEISSLNTAWTGDAAVRFRQSLNSWCTEFQNICNQLQTIEVALESANTTYQKTEANNTHNAVVPGLTGL
jgi:WXG100 family type VII secretion target